VDNGAFTAVAATPEPRATSTLVAMLLGLGGFTAIVRRRKAA
jgi:MYXO-CTERM domain-containing protein